MKTAYIYQCGDCYQINMTVTYKGEYFWCKCSGLVGRKDTVEISDFLAESLD